MNRRRQPADCGERNRTSSLVRVLVAAPTVLEKAALEALLATLPGLIVAEHEDSLAVDVLLWLPAETTMEPPLNETATAVLAVVSDVNVGSQSSPAGLFDPNEPWGLPFARSRVGNSI